MAPFTPTDWKMTFDGETISLCPSIGNWTLKCRSHYVIDHGKVVKAGPWSDEQVEAERRRDRTAKARFYGGAESPTFDTACFAWEGTGYLAPYLGAHIWRIVDDGPGGHATSGLSDFSAAVLRIVTIHYLFLCNGVHQSRGSSNVDLPGWETKQASVAGRPLHYVRLAHHGAALNHICSRRRHSWRSAR